MIFQIRLARPRKGAMVVEANVDTGDIIFIFVFSSIGILTIIDINIIILTIIKIITMIMFSPRGEESGSKRRRNTKTNSSGLDVLRWNFNWSLLWVVLNEDSSSIFVLIKSFYPSLIKFSSNWINHIVFTAMVTVGFAIGRGTSSAVRLALGNHFLP